jgi:hypothetical protein
MWADKTTHIFNDTHNWYFGFVAEGYLLSDVSKRDFLWGSDDDCSIIAGAA